MTKWFRAIKQNLFARRLALLAMVLPMMALVTAAQIQLSKPKAEQRLPNPLMISASREELITITKQMFEAREVPLDKDNCDQLTGECTLISKPVTFITGSIATRSQLEHYAEVPAANVKNWERGRYTLKIQITPAAPKTTQVAVYATFEGKTNDFSGQNPWVQLRSKGELEDKFLRCIQDRARGGGCEGIFEKER